MEQPTDLQPAKPHTYGKDKTPHPQHVRDTVQVMFCQGVTPSIISSQTGVPINTVNTWAKRHGWTRVRDSLTSSRNRIAQAVISESLIDASKAVREGLATELRDQIAALKRDPVRRASGLRNVAGVQGRAAVVKTIADAASTVFGWQGEQKVSLIAPMCGPAVDVQAEVTTEPAALPADQAAQLAPMVGAAGDLDAGPDQASLREGEVKAG